MNTFKVSYVVDKTKYSKSFVVPSLINHYGHGSVKNRLTQLFQSILGINDVDVSMDAVPDQMVDSTIEWSIADSEYKITGRQGWITTT